MTTEEKIKANMKRGKPTIVMSKNGGGFIVSPEHGVIPIPKYLVGRVISGMKKAGRSTTSGVFRAVPVDLLLDIIRKGKR